jgi:hypothetical protein
MVLPCLDDHGRARSPRQQLNKRATSSSLDACSKVYGDPGPDAPGSNEKESAKLASVPRACVLHIGQSRRTNASGSSRWPDYRPFARQSKPVRCPVGTGSRALAVHPSQPSVPDAHLTSGSSCMHVSMHRKAKVPLVYAFHKVCTAHSLICSTDFRSCV